LLASQVRAGIAVSFNALLLALGPGLNSLLTHAAEFFEDELFGFIGFEGIARSVVNNVEKSVKLGLEFGVAL
jgi:hypothetical protein